MGIFADWYNGNRGWSEAIHDYTPVLGWVNPSYHGGQGSKEKSGSEKPGGTWNDVNNAMGGEVGAVAKPSPNNSVAAKPPATRSPSSSVRV